MPKVEYDIETIDNSPGMQGSLQQLARKQWKNFVTESGRFRGQRVVINFYFVRRMNPEQFQEQLQKLFGSNTMYPCKIEFLPDVLVGQNAAAARTTGRKPTKNPIGSHSILWDQDVPDDFLGYLKEKVENLDRILDNWRP